MTRHVPLAAAVLALLLAFTAVTPSMAAGEGSQPADQTVWLPSDETVWLPSDEAVSDPTETPAEGPVGEPTEDFTEQPIDDNTEQPIDENTELPIEEPIDENTEQPVPQPIELLDVPVEKWYWQPTYYCVGAELMSAEEGFFYPAILTDRVTVAVAIYRMSGSPETTWAPFYGDVNEDDWYADAVTWVTENGYFEGFGNEEFGPMKHITREQLATILWRYASRMPSKGTAEPFADAEDVSDWARDAVFWAQEQGILKGRNNNRFVPKDNATRAEIAKVLMGYCKWLGLDYPDVEEPAPVDPWQEFYDIFGYKPEAVPPSANPYIMEGFVADPETWHMSYQYQPYTLGIDVSSHQKEIDWQAVAASGIEFVMIRAGYRGYTKGTLNIDPYFLRNIQGAADAGLDIGVYFFSQATTVAEAIEEANYTLELIRDYDITYPVVFDWERQSYDNSRTKDTTPETIAAAAVAFCETVKAAGYTPMMYSSPSKVYNTLKDNMDYLTCYPFWLAHYTKNMAPSSYIYDFSMWQYTSSGAVPGIDGNVDMNICLAGYGSYTELP